MIGIIKSNDKRYFYLKDYISLNVIYTEREEDLKYIDILIIPLSGIDNFGFIKDTNINIKNVITTNKLKKIICGMKSDYLTELCVKNQIKLYSYLDSAYYKWENAKLTAEGLLKEIITDNNDSLINEKILILGYGYCAKAIYRVLKPLCKNVTIYAHDYHDQKELFCNNIKQSDLTDLEQYSYIINTVDYNIIDKDKIKTIIKSTKIYDVSSYPYGFDLDEALALNIKIDIIPKIPARFMPKTASKVIFDVIAKELE